MFSEVKGVAIISHRVASLGHLCGYHAAENTGVLPVVLYRDRWLRRNQQTTLRKYLLLPYLLHYNTGAWKCWGGGAYRRTSGA